MAARNQTEEVYETPDMPECDQHAAAEEEHFESEHIELLHLDVAAACDKFAGRLLDATTVDLSQCSATSAGYASAPYVLHVIGGDGTAGETPAQRLSRLQHEMAELEKQMHQLAVAQADDDKAHELVDTVKATDVAAINARLKELQAQRDAGGDATEPRAVTMQKLNASIEALKRPTGDGDGTVTYDLVAGPPATTALDQNSAVRIAELEARLAKMETLLGGDSDRLLGATAAVGEGRASTLCDVAELLAVKASLLDIGQLDAVAERAGALAHSMQAAKAQRAADDTAGDNDDKVCELYELMKKWDALCGALPDLVERLRSLQLLHEHAMHVSQSVTYLDGQNQQMEKTIGDVGKMLAEVKSSMADNLITMQKNIAALDARMKAVSGK